MASKKGLGKNVNALLPIVALAGVGFLAWVALGKPTSIESAKTGLMNFFHPTASANYGGYRGWHHPHFGFGRRWGGFRHGFYPSPYASLMPGYGYGLYPPPYAPPFYPAYGMPGWGFHPHFGGYHRGYGHHFGGDHHFGGEHEGREFGGGHPGHNWSEGHIG